MEKPREVLVIYRLKFKSKEDFEKAAETLRFGQNMGKYLESLQMSLGLQQSQPNYYSLIRSPEINICRDDLVIYVCSHEYEQREKGLPITNIITEGMGDTISPLHYYEPFLKARFGAVAEVRVTRG